MKSILIITNILPIATIKRKKSENDILLETEAQLLQYGKKLNFTYIYILPRTYKLLGRVNKRWNEYNRLQNSKFFILGGHKIHVLGIIQLPIIVRFRNILFDLSYWLDKKHITEIIKSIHPDIIHAQNADCDAYLARKIAKDFKIPFVVTLRNVHKIKDRIVQSNLNAASTLIAISPTQFKDAHRITNKKIDLVPHGIDANFFVKQKRKFIKGPIKFVVVARLLDWKYIDKVIIALSKVDYDYIFDIYGDGPEYNRIQELIKTKEVENKVVLKGRVPNESLPNILPQYDMFLMPSYPETLGRVYFEAMACSLPVLACKNTGIDGIITHGIEGFLANPTQDVINEYILKIGRNPEVLSSMGKAAYRTAKKYSWAIIAKRYDQIYHSI